MEVAEGAFLSKSYGEPGPIPAVRVVNVSGPCKKAGLRPGDLVSSIKGRQVGSLNDFNTVVASVAPNCATAQSNHFWGSMKLLLSPFGQTPSPKHPPYDVLPPVGSRPPYDRGFFKFCGVAELSPL